MYEFFYFFILYFIFLASRLGRRPKRLKEAGETNHRTHHTSPIAPYPPLGLTPQQLSQLSMAELQRLLQSLNGHPKPSFLPANIFFENGSNGSSVVVLNGADVSNQSAAGSESGYSSFGGDTPSSMKSHSPVTSSNAVPSVTVKTEPGMSGACVMAANNKANNIQTMNNLNAANAVISMANQHHVAPPSLSTGATNQLPPPPLPQHQAVPTTFIDQDSSSGSPNSIPSNPMTPATPASNSDEPVITLGTIKLLMMDAKKSPSTERAQLIEQVIATVDDAHSKTCNFTKEKLEKAFKIFDETRRDNPMVSVCMREIIS